jgi:hypothetical protein
LAGELEECGSGRARPSALPEPLPAAEDAVRADLQPLLEKHGLLTADGIESTLGDVLGTASGGL